MEKTVPAGIALTALVAFVKLRGKSALKKYQDYTHSLN